MVHVREQLAVVNPDVVGVLDTNGVTGIGKDLGNLQVPDNDIALSVDTKTNTNQSYLLYQHSDDPYSCLLKIGLPAEEDFPRILLLEPTLTTALPVMVPLM